MAKGTSALKKVEIFSDLTKKELELLAARMRPIESADAEVLFSEGDSGDEMYLITRGAVAISVKAADATELVIAEFRSGEFFGEMSIIERAPRSATCRTTENSSFLALRADDFYELLRVHPEAAMKILFRMLSIVNRRLLNTGSLLSDMVRWGEGARRRAITDEFTGLFNRRFLDEAIETQTARAKAEGRGLALVMVDLDHFGDLNKAYGQAFGDEVILSASVAFKKRFRAQDILARYGGDEFTFILPDTDADVARRLCDDACRAVGELRFAQHPELRLSASIGVAVLSDSGGTAMELKEQADKALYAAKEQGRGRAVVLGNSGGKSPPGIADRVKQDITGLKQRNRIIDRIIEDITTKESFLLLGHKGPDEDCIASLVAFALLLGKFNRRVTVSTCGKVQDQLAYLLNICNYNGIRVSEGCEDLPKTVDAVVILDTPKPSMIDSNPAIDQLLADPAVRKIEIDHHLEADAAYAGDEGFRLVATASSTCELIGLLTLKLANRTEILAQYGVVDLFSRNLTLAILTGIIGDSKMGKYLKSARERWFYRFFSSMFEAMLAKKTTGTANFASMEGVFNAIQRLSAEENACFQAVIRRARKHRRLSAAVFDPVESAELHLRFGADTVVAVTKAAADHLADDGGRAGLVVYCDDPSKSNLVQFRLRRSQGFAGLDLRTVLTHLRITNGGGHPGAVGFRVDRSQVPDFRAYVEGLVGAIADLVEAAD